MRFEPLKLDIVVPTIVGAATILISVWQYLETAEQEAKKPFLELQMELCADASNVAAILATNTDEFEWNSAKARFLELYWGELVIVEDRSVEDVMLRFEEVLRDLEGPADPEVKSFGTLEQLSLQLATACRELMLSSWDVELEPLKRQLP